MSDDFDVLEMHSNAKTEKVEVNWRMAIDTMQSKLAQVDDPQSRQKILNAILDGVVQMAELDRTMVLAITKNLREYQDNIGHVFQEFSTLNDDEQGVIDEAQKAMERARVKLEDVRKTPDKWWNNLLGRINKIKKEEQRYNNAKNGRTEAENKAKTKFQKRVEDADLQKLLNELSSKSQTAVTRLKNREIEIKGVEDHLQVVLVEASQNYKRALEKKKDVEAQLDANYALLRKSHKELAEIMDKQSSEYVQSNGRASSLEQKIEDLEGQKNAYTALAASKDAFDHKYSLTIQLLTSLRNHLQTHRSMLYSVAEERLTYYNGYVAALKEDIDHEFAVILDTSGVKISQNIRAASSVGSAKAVKETVSTIPVHEKMTQGAYGSYTEALQEIRQKDLDIGKKFIEKYGIDMTEIFDIYYRADANKSLVNKEDINPISATRPIANADDVVS